jgi:hypothetical protein
MTTTAARKEVDDFFRRHGFNISRHNACCVYHGTGGLPALGCGGDIYVHEEPEKHGPQFKRGFNGGWQP